MSTANLYAEQILDHAHHPRCQTPLERPTITHREENLSCGDVITLSLVIKNGTITGVAWEGTGCAVSQAAMSLLSETLTGKNVKSLLALKKEEVFSLLGVPIGIRRLKCALLGLHTLKNALQQHQKLPPQDWSETVGG